MKLEQHQRQEQKMTLAQQLAELERRELREIVRECREYMKSETGIHDPEGYPVCSCGELVSSDRCDFCGRKVQ